MITLPLNILLPFTTCQCENVYPCFIGFLSTISSPISYAPVGSISIAPPCKSTLKFIVFNFHNAVIVVALVPTTKLLPASIESPDSIFHPINV